jgi:two-component system, chemotaxis family, sensor kinase Cph1
MLQWLFEKDFMPHGHCYFWRPDILWTHVLSDGIIALAYFSIPVTLVYFLNKRRDFPFRGVLALFAAFIILCGTTHILGIITVWKPIYAIDGLVKAATALVSIATALVLIPLVPIALGMRSPAELEAANKLLQEEIERRRETEARLEVAVEKLHRSNEELEQFASIASHDLQSPLRAIVNFTQLLKGKVEGKLDKDAGEFLDFIEQGGKRMQSLISDLLQVARINKGLPEMTVVSMNQVLESVREQLRLSLEETGATLEATDLPDVLGHEGQLVQLLQNLIGNAAKYVAPGVKPVIRIRATREQNDWHFVVADNGIGIKPEHLKSIFVIFRRLHRDDQYPGSGIGLSVCKKIIERHQGRIWVTSKPDKGSEFHFTLPVA